MADFESTMDRRQVVTTFVARVTATLLPLPSMVARSRDVCYTSIRTSKTKAAARLRNLRLQPQAIGQLVLVSDGDVLILNGSVDVPGARKLEI